MVWQILARSSRRGQPSGARVVSIPDAHPLFRERPPGSREPPVFPGGGPFPPLSGNDSGRERCFPAPVLGLPFPPGPAFPAGNREAGNAQPPSRRPAPAPPQVSGHEHRLPAGDGTARHVQPLDQDDSRYERVPRVDGRGLIGPCPRESPQIRPPSQKKVAEPQSPAPSAQFLRTTT
jgi:hypothetical protein